MKTFRLLALVLPAACANTTTKPVEGRAQAPIQVRWEARELTVKHALLVAHIKRLAPFPGSLSVKIIPPNEGKVRVGRTSFEVPANAQADEITENLEVTYGQLPAQDLLLRVAGTGQGRGVSFEVPYRFGREDPVVVSPQPTGPAVQLNGRNLGPSIPLPSSAVKTQE